MRVVYVRMRIILLVWAMGVVSSQGKQSICADIVFALETSCSVDDETKALAKVFIQDFVTMFDSVKQKNVSNVATQFGLLAYDATPRPVFTFDEALSKQEILQRIETFKMETTGCKTLTHNAINMASDDFFETTLNDRRTPDVLVVLTDGRTQPQKYIQKTTDAIQKLRETVRTIVIELPNKKGRESLPETLEQLNTLAEVEDRFKLDDDSDIEDLATEVFDHLLDRSEFVCPPADPVHSVHPCHEKCQYTPPPPKTAQPGLGRFSRVNVMLDCTYEENCDIQFLKDFAAELDRQPKCKMYYPLKAVAENRLYVIYGCERAGYLEKALMTKDQRFTCQVQPIMDYYDFAISTLGLNVSQEMTDAVMPRASLKCEHLIAVFRELNYPPGKTFEEIMAAWKGHALVAYVIRGTTGAENAEVFHYVGEEREVIFRVWDSPELLDSIIVGANGGNDWVLQKKMTSGLTHRTKLLLHLDCICNPDRDMYA
ncbi:unnamed protein product [Owenia fusiformis]|uniref:Uncharacterized protein n=1 Tax=Owenia fusiformis TaxID=6347 RepID=A0A8J1UC43_OWEFU|nr:unnamed protein product [Owenia fusiformis]